MLDDLDVPLGIELVVAGRHRGGRIIVMGCARFVLRSAFFQTLRESA